MKVTILIVLLISLISCKNSTSADAGSTNLVKQETAAKKKMPAFVDNYFLGRDLKEVRSKYHEAVQKDSCSEQNRKLCSKEKIKCSCYKVPAVSTQFWKRNFYFVVVNNVVVKYTDNTDAIPQLITQKVETVRSMFGDEAPDEIFEEKENWENFRVFSLFWKHEKGFSGTNVLCPLEKVAGKMQATMPLRDCFSVITTITSLENFTRPKENLSANVKY